MKTCTQTDILGMQYAPEEVIDILADAGYDAIDWSFFEMIRGEGIWLEEGWKEHAYAVRAKADSRGIPVVQAHAPFPSGYGDPEKDSIVFDRIVRSMEVASILGVKNIIVHPITCMGYRTNRKEAWRINQDFYSRLLPYCEKFDITVCAENMWGRSPVTKNIESYFCGEPDDFCEFIDLMDSPRIRACLDLGHSALVGIDPAFFIRALGKDRLHALHVHDVDLYNDLHTMPFTQKLDWESICKALGETGYKGYLTLEADNFLKKMPHELWIDGEKLMSSAARYLANRSESYRA